MGVKIGSLTLASGFVGNKELQSVWTGNDLKWSAVDPLTYFIEGEFTTYENDLVTLIGTRAFSGCTGLHSVSFPNVTSIGSSAFADCTSLISVSFPKLTSLGDFAFQNCQALRSVSFPNVTSIGEYAFSACKALASVSLLANQVCTIVSTSFPSDVRENVTEIRVPAALVDAYKADSVWATLADKIVGV